MHVLVSVAGNLDLIVDGHHQRLVHQVRQPLLGKAGVPLLVDIALGEWGDPRSVSELSISSVGVVGVKPCLVCSQRISDGVSTKHGEPTGVDGRGVRE